MQNEKIIQAIAEYLERKTIQVWTPSGEKMAFVKPTEYSEFSERKFCQEIAEEIAAAIAPHMEEPDFPLSKLFDHMSNEHGLTLLDTELGDIIHIARCK